MHFFQESNSSTAASMPYPKVAPFYFSYVTLQTIDSEEFFFSFFFIVSKFISVLDNVMPNTDPIFALFNNSKWLSVVFFY